MLGQRIVTAAIPYRDYGSRIRGEIEHGAIGSAVKTVYRVRCTRRIVGSVDILHGQDVMHGRGLRVHEGARRIRPAHGVLTSVRTIEVAHDGVLLRVLREIGVALVGYRVRLAVAVIVVACVVITAMRETKAVDKFVRDREPAVCANLRIRT